METSLQWLVLCVAAVISGCSCYHWSNVLPDATIKYECTGTTAILPWTISLGNGEEIVDIRWLFHGQSDEVIALYSHGTFVPLPAFSHRTRLVPNAGIALDHVTTSDTGNYSVEVTGRFANGVQFILRRYVILQVIEGVLTSADPLRASQRAEAAFSNTTQQWHAVLTCGTFKYPPPFDIEWTTPSGHVVPSSGYEDGQFLLLLDNPVLAGSYTCNVSQASASDTCLHANNSHLGEAAVTVDRLEARLSVVEAQQRALVAENNKLKAQPVSQNNSACCQQIDHLSQDNASLNKALQAVIQNNSELTQHVHQLSQSSSSLSHQVHDLSRRNLDLRHRVERLEQDNSNLNSSVGSLHHDYASLLQKMTDLSRRVNQSLHAATTTPKVSFHARGLKDQHVHHGRPLVLPTVVTNEGHGYDPSTGNFHAPVSGTYWFMASTEVIGEDHKATLKLMADNGWDDYLQIHNEDDVDTTAGTLHAVLRLHRGHRAWLQSTEDSYMASTPTAFSGFLLYTD